MWTVKRDLDDVIVDCLRPITCPHCGGVEKLLMSKLLNFDLEPGSGKREAHAIDMECRCQSCGHWETFGVAIKKSEYDRMSVMLNDSPLKDNYAESDTGIIKGMLMNMDAMGSSMKDHWERTNDMRGHVSKFDVLCYHCKLHGHEIKMFLRYAYISPREDATQQVYGTLNQIEYKCKKCAWTTKFLVEDDQDYLKEVMDMREKGGCHRNLFYLKPEQWAEDEEMKKQLAALGYVGGREDV